MTSSMTIALAATVNSSPPISPRRTACDSETGPPWTRAAFVSLAAMSLARSPMRRATTRPRMLAIVSTPMPPICIARMMTTLPKGDQCVAMSTVVRPVTQMAETAVNTASASGVPPVPLPARAIGRVSSSVVMRMRTVKMRIANRAGDAVADSPRPAHARANGLVRSSRRLPRMRLLVAIDAPHRPADRVQWYSRAGLTSLVAWPTSST